MLDGEWVVYWMVIAVDSIAIFLPVTQTPARRQVVEAEDICYVVYNIRKSSSGKTLSPDGLLEAMLAGLWSGHRYHGCGRARGI